MKVTAVAILFWALTAFAVQDANPDPIRISAAVAAKLLLKSADAIYPEGPEDPKGFVTAELHIGIDGIVSNVEVGFAHPGLAESAVTAFRQYRFKPYSPDGKPMEFLVSAHAIFWGRDSHARTVSDADEGPRFT